MTAAPDIKHNLPPDHGWLVDITKEQKDNLAGAMVNAKCGAKATTGLVLGVEDDVVRLFCKDRGKPVEYLVVGTMYSRVPGTPMRPALAAALVCQHTWDVERASLTDADGNARNQYLYDSALADFEQDVARFYDDLIREYSSAVFNSAATGPGGNT